MKRILIVYNTVTGSTAEMAEIIRNEMKGECSVEMASVAGAPSVDRYDAVIIGSPMRFGGFSRPIRTFINKNRSALQGVCIFCYLSILYIVKIEEEPLPDIESFVDPSLGMPILPIRKASLFDRKHSLWCYNSAILKSTGGLKLSSIGYMYGRLIIKKLGLFQKLFMRLITSFTRKEREGEFLNPSAVKKWASDIIMALNTP